MSFFASSLKGRHGGLPLRRLVTPQNNTASLYSEGGVLRVAENFYSALSGGVLALFSDGAGALVAVLALAAVFALRVCSFSLIRADLPERERR